MTIILDRPLPAFVSAAAAAESQVWGRQLTLEKGQRCCVTAASGRGKTTLVHMLYGLARSFAGRVTVNGVDRAAGDADAWIALRRTGLAVVFQDLRLFPHLSAADNVFVNGVLTGCVDRGRLVEHAKQLGLHDQLDTPCGRLSLGEQQRVALLRALAQPFSWLLLDEPFSHLDAASAAAAANLIGQVCAARGAGWVLTALAAGGPLTADREVRL